MAGVAGETTGTVFDNVPGVVAGSPGQRRLERVEEIKQCPAHEHIVVGAEHKGNDNCGQTNTCRVTVWRGHKVRHDSAEIRTDVGEHVYTLFLKTAMQSLP